MKSGWLDINFMKLMNCEINVNKLKKAGWKFIDIIADTLTVYIFT